MSIETKTRRIIYRIKHRYPTRELAMVVFAGIAVVWFIWGSVQAMQKNYDLRKVVDDKARQAQLTELEMRTLEYEQRYLQSEEYRKLAVRERLGYADPGEKVLMLPANSPEAKQVDTASATAVTQPRERPEPSNLSQWATFLFGGNVRNE